jgi:large subunit ribosomal protein L5
MAMPRLLGKYRTEIIPALIKRFNYKNVMKVPRLTKIVVNMGIGEASRDIKDLDAACKELSLITGQKPKITRSTKSISAFKVREGNPVGCCVTLRGAYMYEFLDRLINVSIPRIRDFRGLSPNNFDGRGNHSIGVKEHLIFMELDYNTISRVRGMNITTVTTAGTDEEALELLKLYGMPFRDK